MLYVFPSLKLSFLKSSHLRLTIYTEYSLQLKSLIYNTLKQKLKNI